MSMEVGNKIRALRQAAEHQDGAAYYSDLARKLRERGYEGQIARVQGYAAKEARLAREHLNRAMGTVSDLRDFCA